MGLWSWKDRARFFILYLLARAGIDLVIDGANALTIRELFLAVLSDVITLVFMEYFLGHLVRLRRKRT